MGRNPLHLAAEKGHLNICKVFLESTHGIQLATLGDRVGMMPIDMAIVHGQVEAMKLFLELKGAVPLTETPGVLAKALLTAAQHGQAPVADMLLDRHPEVDWLDSEGTTVFHLAAYKAMDQPAAKPDGLGRDRHWPRASKSG